MNTPEKIYFDALLSGFDQSSKLEALQSILTNIGQGVEAKYFKASILRASTAMFAEHTSPLAVDEHVKDALEGLKFIESKSTKNKVEYAYTLFHWLFAYGSRVRKKSSNFQDVSVFDDNRIEAAKIACGNPEAYSLLKGDISGIQKFIFSNIDTSQVQATQGLAKKLRGRSFSIALFTDMVAEIVINELGLQQANIIFAGGGHFTLLIPSLSEEEEQELSLLQKKLNLLLIQTVSPSLGLELVHESFDLNNEYDFARAGKNLSAKIERNKRKKHIDYLDEILFHNNDAVSFNADFILGEKVPYCRYLLEVNFKDVSSSLAEQLKKDERVVLDTFQEWNRYVVLIAKKGIIISSEGERSGLREFLKDYEEDIANAKVFCLNEVDFIPLIPHFTDFSFPVAFGFKYIGQSAPRYEDFLTDTPFTSVEKDREGQNRFPKGIVAFEDLSQINYEVDYSRETDLLEYNQLAVMRLDVDDLGAIFNYGLNPPSIKRVASLSREMQVFFAGYFNLLAQSFQLYVTYSGGDDAFVVGSWYNILHFAEALKENFSKFTCTNSEIKFSAGIFQCSPYYPIAKFAEKTADLLDDRSKKYFDLEELDELLNNKYQPINGDKVKTHNLQTKGAITVFNYTTNWSTFMRMMQMARDFDHFIIGENDNTQQSKERQVRRSLLQRLLFIIQSGRTSLKISKDDPDYAMQFYQNTARLHYLLARQGFSGKNLEEQNSSKLSKYIQEILRNYTNEASFEDYVIPFNYQLLKTRKSKS